MRDEAGRGGAGDPTEAELVAAVVGHPEDRDLLLRLAERSAGTGAWRTAEWCWRRLLLLDDSPRASTGLAAALSAQGRTSAADAVLADAKTRFAADVEPAAACARLAAGRGEWREALRRWESVQDAFPDRTEGWRGAATAMTHLGRPDDARELLHDALARFGPDPDLLHDLGRTAELLSEWPEAERCWRAFLTLERQPWAHTALARALSRMRRGDEALAIMAAEAEAIARADPFHVADALMLATEHAGPVATDLTRRFEQALRQPDLADATFQVQFAYARAAKRLGEFQAYRDRAEALFERFGHVEVEARLTVNEARELWHRDGDLLRDPVADADLARFESLGGGGGRGGCEFGFLQRKHGLEPLGLLRWATIEPEKLAEALERRFEGIGEPGAVRLEAQHGYDWRATDLVYGVRMDHTHLDRNSVDEATALRQVSTRLQFLARKLIGDLAEAEKIFVYRMAGAGLAPDMLLRLSRALASYGDGLLVVVCEDGPASETEFSEVAPNLLAASHASFSLLQPPTLEEVEPSWLAICARALAWQAELRPDDGQSRRD
jgi:Flp pilus assembly protein TadD